eukprot:11160277-Lingulodinium_polyedra.AAC.1
MRRAPTASSALTSGSFQIEGSPSGCLGRAGCSIMQAAPLRAAAYASRRVVCKSWLPSATAFLSAA